MTMTAERAARSIVPQKPLPNADLSDLANGIRWADHALQRCQERNISPYEVVAAVLWPDSTSPDAVKPDCRNHFRGDLRIIFDTKRRRVVTVMTLNDASVPRVALTPDNPTPPISTPPALVALKSVKEAMPAQPKFTSGSDALLDWMKSLNPGDTFSRKDFLDKYMPCGLSEGSLTVALSVARTDKELLNYNDDKTLAKGTWKIPVQPVKPVKVVKAVTPTFVEPTPEEETPVAVAVNGTRTLHAVDASPLPVTKLEAKAKHMKADDETPAKMTAAQAKKAVGALMEQAMELVESVEGASWTTFGNPDERTFKITWKQAN